MLTFIIMESGLQADLVVFKAKRNYVIHLMNEARCTYYKEFIDENSSDQSKLFRASKSLLNLQADKSLLFRKSPYNYCISSVSA